MMGYNYSDPYYGHGAENIRWDIEEDAPVLVVTNGEKIILTHELSSAPILPDSVIETQDEMF